MRVALVDYGAGNLRSVSAALARAGAEPFATREPDEVLDAPLAIVAGVGHLASAMDGLSADGTGEALRARVEAGRPVLGICVGMQLLFEESEEGGAGLGLLRGPVRRLDARRVPHMGWNTLAVAAESALLGGRRRGGRLLRPLVRRVPATTASPSAEVDHDGPVVAAVEPGRWPASSSTPSEAPPRARASRERGAMVKKRVIPCLDVAGGRVVKGVRFENLRDMGDPVELATRYSELGADELVFLDITATLESRGPLLELVDRAAAELEIPFTVGGGVRSVEDGSRAAARGGGQGRRQPRRARRIRSARAAGRRVRVTGGRLRDRRSRRRGRHARGKEPTRNRCGRLGGGGGRRGAGELLVTSIDADGTRAGYDLALTGAIAAAVEVPVIASGGAGAPGISPRRSTSGAEAALIASIVHERPERLRELKRELRGDGMERQDLARS